MLGSMKGDDLLPLIRANGRAERYSENLMKWVRQNRKRDLFVAFATEGTKVYDPKKTAAGSLYVGYGPSLNEDGFLHGSRLSDVLCNGLRAGAWAFPPKMQFVEVQDFWARYIALGKCAVDPEHSLYFDRERWHSEDDKSFRRCIWCFDFYQQEHVEMVEQKTWRAIPRRWEVNLGKCA
jgi:hypothetical protein